MKTTQKSTFFLIFILAFSSLKLIAQTIYAGSEVIDNERKEGFYMVLFVDDKYVSKEWKEYIQKFGKVAQSHDMYVIDNAKMPFISPDPIKFVSLIKSYKNKSIVSCIFDLGGGRTITNKKENTKEVEQLLKTFYEMAMVNEEIRFAEDDLDDAQKYYDKTLREAKKIEGNIASNQKNRDELLSKLDKNGEEYQLFSQSQSDSTKTITDKEKIAKDLKKNTKEKSSIGKKLERNQDDYGQLLKDKKQNAQEQEDALVFIEEKKVALKQIQSKR